MSKAKIKEKLDIIRAQKSFDERFIDILADSNALEETADATAEKAVVEINRRYDENKENQA